MKQFILTHKLLCIILACVVVVGAACAIVLPIALKHDHTFSTEWSFDKTNHWHAATCEHNEEVKDKAAHDFNDGEITTPTTEETAGVKTFTCKTCGYKKTEEVAKLEHVHKFAEEWSFGKTNHWHAATCEHTEETRDLDAHTFGDWTVKTPADYGVEGEEKAVCNVCGYEKTRPVEALQPKDNTITVGKIEFVYNAKSQSIDSLVTAGNKEGMVIEYVGDGETTYEKSTTAPTNAGAYQYTIKIPATAEWNAAEVSGKFTIKQYELTKIYEKQTIVYDGKAEKDGTKRVWFAFNTLEDNTRVLICVIMDSANVGAIVSDIVLPGLLRTNNYTIDKNKVQIEIVAKKLSNLEFEIYEDDVENELTEQIITREIEGVNGEKIVVEITFNPEELINEEALELSFDGKGGATCIIKFKTENPNYELDLTLGELKLVRLGTV